jgi:hypothetical protein
MWLNLSRLRPSLKGRPFSLWRRIVVGAWIYCIPLALAMEEPEGRKSEEYRRSAKSARTLLSTTDASLSPRKTVRILTIDGGGISSIIPATILEKIEEQLQADHGDQKVHLAHYFDIMAATSTSSIIALGLSALHSAHDIVRLYMATPNKLFCFRSSSPEGPSSYDALFLEETLDSLFEEKWMKEAASHTLVTADNLGQKCAYLFDSHQARLASYNFKMKDVARVACAHFPAAIIKDETRIDDHTFTDGGLYANDPTFEAVRAAERNFPGCDLYILSLGTGEEPRKFGDLILNQGETITASQLSYEMRRHQQDRHLGYLSYIKTAFKRQGRKVKYTRLQVPLDPSINPSSNLGAINNLRQAGLSFSNPQNEKYAAFEKTLKHLRKVKKLHPDYEGVTRRERDIGQEKTFKAPYGIPSQCVGPLKSLELSETTIKRVRAQFSLPVAHFVRTDHLKRLEEELHNLEKVLLGQIPCILLRGIGGSGKTTLARAFADNAQKNGVSIVWELDAQSWSTLYKSFCLLALELTDDRQEKDKIREYMQKSTQEEGIDNLKVHLFPLLQKYTQQQKWLFIFDNAVEAEMLRSFCPRKVEHWGEGRVLITTQDQNLLSNWGTSIELKEITNEEKLKLYQTILYKTPPQRCKKDGEDENFLKNIPSFPLDVSLAAYYLRENIHLEYEDYLAELEKYSDLFDKTQQDILGNLVEGYSKTRYKIIVSSVNQILKDTPALTGILFFSSLFKSHYLPTSLLNKYVEMKKVNKQLITIFKNKMGKYSLLSLEQSKDEYKQEILYTFHPSTQIILRSYFINNEEFSEGEAAYILGKLYVEDFNKVVNFTHFDFSEPGKYFKIAAIKKHSISQAIVGSLYYTRLMLLEEGEKEKNLTKLALDYWNLAAEQGNIDAKRALQWMHKNEVNELKTLIPLNNIQEVEETTGLDTKIEKVIKNDALCVHNPNLFFKDAVEFILKLPYTSKISVKEIYFMNPAHSSFVPWIQETFLLAGLLKKASCLECLNLAGLFLDPLLINVLAYNLPNLSSLSTLKLGGFDSLQDTNNFLSILEKTPLKGLKTLDLSIWYIKEFPECIALHTGLETLKLWSHKITFITPNIKLLTNLQSLNLSGTNLKKIDIRSLKALISLKNLDLTSTELGIQNFNYLSEFTNLTIIGAKSSVLRFPYKPKYYTNFIPEDRCRNNFLEADNNLSVSLSARSYGFSSLNIKEESARLKDKGKQG